MPDNLPTIEFPAAIVDLKYPLMRLRQALGGKGPVRVVAMGSSSTAGRGDVVGSDTMTTRGLPALTVS